MTISSTTRKAGPFFGNDATIDFPFTFKVFKKQDLLVTLTNPEGNDTPLVLDSDYSVTLNSNQDANPGGTVRYPVSGAPLSAAWRLTVTGSLAYTQPTDIQNNGGFYPQVVEDMSDRSTIQIQQLAEGLGRSLKLSVSDTDGSGAYRAGGNRITDVGDPIADSDAVNRRSMFAFVTEYVDKAVAGVVGGFGWFLQAGVGAIFRAFQDKMRDTVSVRDYIDTAIDGVTSNQAGIEAAVTAAYERGANLEWPAGVYVSTANIPNLHLVRHKGAGMILRGADTFRLKPLTESLNVLYVSTSAGVAGNDGLSAAQAMPTLQAGIDALSNYGPILRGVWRIQKAAGTYARARFPDEGLYSARPIEIAGPDVGGHPNVPTAVLTEGADGVAASGLLIRQFMRIKVKDVKAVGWNGTASAMGISVGGFSELYTENVHTTNCTWGISAGEHATLDVKGGILEQNGYQPGGAAYTQGGALRGLFHTKFSVGLQNAGNLLAGPIMRNNNYAVWAQEHCNGHLDWSTLEDNGTHVRLNIASRLNMDGSSFKRAAAVAVWGEANSIASVSNNTVFGTGVDANDINFLMNGGSHVAPTSMFNDGILPATSERCIARAVINQTVNSTAPTIIRQLTLKAQLWRDRAASNSGMKRLRYRLYGSLSGTAGYKRLQSRFGATPLNVTFTSSETGLFVLDGRLMINTDPVGNQVQVIEATRAGAVMRIASGTTSEALTANTIYNIEALVENVADSIVITAYEIYVDGL